MPEEITTGVVGVEFDDSGDDAIIAALRWAAELPNRVLHAVHVIDPHSVKDNPVKPALVAEDEALANVPLVLAGWMRELAERHHLPFDKERVRAHARIGKVVETVLQVAVDYDADVILVGTHGRRGVERFLLGSVAERLVRNAHCPVLVARPKDYGGLSKTELPAQPYAPGQGADFSSLREPDRNIRTESEIWRPGGGRPTGFRIV